MTRKTLFAALEDAAVLTGVEEINPDFNAEDKIAELVTDAEMSGVEEIKDGIDNGAASIDALEELVCTLEGLTTFNDSHAAMARTVMTTSMRMIGANAAQANKAVPAIESIYTREVAIESAVEKMKEIGKGIIETAKRWWAKLVEFFTGLFDKLKGLQKRHTRLLGAIAKVGHFKQEAKTTNPKYIAFIDSMPAVSSTQTVLKGLMEFTKKNQSVFEKMKSATSAHDDMAIAELFKVFHGIVGAKSGAAKAERMSDEFLGGWNLHMEMTAFGTENPNNQTAYFKEIGSFKATIVPMEVKKEDSLLMDGNQCKVLLENLKGYFKLMAEAQTLVATGKKANPLPALIKYFDSDREIEMQGGRKVQINFAAVYHTFRVISCEPLNTIVVGLFKTITTALQVAETSIMKGVALNDLPEEFRAGNNKLLTA